MAKIGRNDACPCGSGKKYKHCCLRAASKPRRPAPPQAAASGLPWLSLPGASGGEASPTHPYVLARHLEISGRGQHHWVPGRVRELSTTEILEKLQGLGVQVQPEEFSTDPPLYSAWRISEPWLDQVPRLRGRDLELLGLAACELWRRFHPERPSFEMLDDAMQEGYRLSMSGQEAEACAVWWDLWLQLRARLPPDLRTCDDAEAVFPGSQALFNWLQDFQLELSNASLDAPAWAERGVELCRDVVAVCPEESFVRQFRCWEGEFHFRGGGAAAGRHLLEELIEEDPDDPCAYAYLAEALGIGLRGAEPVDRGAAIELLEKALARPVRDPTSRDLVRRLAHLRGEAPTARQPAPEEEATMDRAGARAEARRARKARARQRKKGKKRR